MPLDRMEFFLLTLIVAQVDVAIPSLSGACNLIMKANPTPEDRFAFAWRAGNHVPAFLFTSFQKDDGTLLKSHVFTEHEFEAPTYPMDYHEACVDEVAEDDRAGLGTRREQIEVVEDGLTVCQSISQPPLSSTQGVNLDLLAITTYGRDQEVFLSLIEEKRVKYF